MYFWLLILLVATGDLGDRRVMEGSSAGRSEGPAALALRAAHVGRAVGRLNFLTGPLVLLKAAPVFHFAHSHATNHANPCRLFAALGARHAVRRVGLELGPALEAAERDPRGGVGGALAAIRVPRRAGAEHLPREQVGELLRAELEDLAVRVGLSAKSEVRVDRGDADEGGEDAEVGVVRDPHLLEPELVLAPLVVVVDLLT